jgi:hypothetical protein
MVIPGEGLKNMTLLMGMAFTVREAPVPQPPVIKKTTPPIPKKGAGDQSRLSVPPGPAPLLTFARVEIACLHEYLDRR